MHYQEVMLVRCLPAAPRADSVLGALSVSGGRPRLVFFHGPGLAWARSELAPRVQDLAEAGTTLMLCSAGWRRRQIEPPPDGWQLGSLVQFWDAADRAEWVAGFGVGMA